MGRLEVIVGAMFSGKSEELLRRLRRAEIGGYKIVIVKPTVDTRYNTGRVTSHAGSFRDAIIVENAHDIKLKAFGYSVVGVDEVQFFSPEIVDVLTEMATKQIVIASGLDQTFRGEPFGSVPQLMALADQVDKLKAVCHSCGSMEATKTQRLTNGVPASFKGSTVQVGGLESYEARCRACWQEG